ncbi:hypothetical protein ACP3V3_19665 [Vibrio sp. PNB22_3_1]
MKTTLAIAFAIATLTGCNPKEHHSIPLETQLNYSPIIVHMAHMTSITITPEPPENTITAVKVTEGRGKALIQNSSIQFLPHPKFHGKAKLIYRTIIAGIPTDRFIYVHVLRDEVNDNSDGITDPQIKPNTPLQL